MTDEQNKLVGKISEVVYDEQKEHAKELRDAYQQGYDDGFTAGYEQGREDFIHD
jgi:flagellar biosynthesis/type III secretory pathway protein FliH